MPKFVLLWTDATIWALVAFMVAYAVMVARSPNLKASWRKVFRDAPALCSSLILALCLLITAADSLHYRLPLKGVVGGSTVQAYDTVTRSGLDWMLSDLIASREVTYSRPLDYLSYRRDTVSINGQLQRVSPRLLHGG
ncbi:MAG: ABC transporter permease, partial [Caulobacter sp.]|nr:ABC transporter permease [Vitreoscilla sp.]